jgi:hypothetical protein
MKALDILIVSMANQQSGITPEFSRAERTAHNVHRRKKLEKHAIEASRCNELLDRPLAAA